MHEYLTSKMAVLLSAALNDRMTITDHARALGISAKQMSRHISELRKEGRMATTKVGSTTFVMAMAPEEVLDDNPFGVSVETIVRGIRAARPDFKWPPT